MFQIEDGISDQLAGSVESSLPATESFVEKGFAISLEVEFLGWRDGANFASAASVDGRELGGDDRGWWRRSCERRGLVGEEGGDETVLEMCGVSVGSYAWEFEVTEMHFFFLYM